MNDQISVRALTKGDLESVCSRSRLFAILDACEDPPVFEKVMDLGVDRALCLHGGGLDEEERQVAPYVVRVDSELLTWVFDEPWGRPWGVFLVSSCDERTLRPYLRSLLIAEDPEGNPIYLRFFDPRIIPMLLESSTRGQLEEIFGPVEALVVPDIGSESAVMYRLTNV